MDKLNRFTTQVSIYPFTHIHTVLAGGFYTHLHTDGTATYTPGACTPLWQLLWEHTAQRGCLSTTQKQKLSASGHQNPKRNHLPSLYQITNLPSLHTLTALTALEAPSQKTAALTRTCKTGSSRPHPHLGGWGTESLITVISYTSKLPSTRQYGFPLSNEPWTINVCNLKMSEKFCIKCHQRILKVTWQDFVLHSVVLQRNSCIMHYQLSWLSHGIRMPVSHLTTQNSVWLSVASPSVHRDQKKRLKDQLKTFISVK